MSSLSRDERRLYPASVILFGIVLLLFVLPRWITLNRWIPSLSETFHQTTGRTLSIREIRPSFWSGPELQFFNVEIGGKGGEGRLASIGEVRIGIQLLPLLWRRVVVREIHLVDPLFSVSRDREGVWNFEDLLPKGPEEKPGRWKISNQSSEITVARGEIGFVDHTIREGPLQWTAKEIDAAASRLWLGREVRLRLDVASIWRGREAEKAARLGLAGVVQGDRSRFDLKKGSADLTLTLTGFDSELVRPYVRTKLIPPFIFKTSTFHIEANSRDLVESAHLFRSPLFRLKGSSSEGLIFLFPDRDPVSVKQAEWIYRDREGHFTLSGLQLMKSHLESISFDLLHPFEKPEWHIRTAGRIALPDLAEVLASKTFEIDQLKRIKSKGILELAVEAKIPPDPNGVDLHGRLALKEGEFTPVSFMKPVRKVEGTARFERTRLEVESIEGEWGGAPFKITGRMPHVFKKGVEFNFDAPFLDLADLFLPSSAPVKPKPKTPAAPEQTDTASPSERRKGYVVGLVQIDHLKVEGFDLAGFKSAATYQERTVQLQDIEARVDGGSLKVDFAQAHFNEDDTVSLAMTPHLSEIDFEEALKDFHQDDGRPFMSGRFMTMGGVESEGRNFEEFKKNLKGSLVLYFEEGTLYRFKTLGRIFTLMHLRRLPDLNEKGLPYRVISTKLTIAKGVVTLHDAVIFGRDVRMIARGIIDLPGDRLNMEMGVQVFKVVDDLIRQIPVGSPILLGEDKMFIAAYFDVGGSIEDPTVRFRPLRTIQKSILSVLKRILNFPLKPKLFQK
ncbi:MAG TPA: AsmA-like C-terminal domain-containing protein [Candidatus Manganitrophaceae bacterium]|nr:AsmA-like C-terminal domain-containing protein [Candidatus Manganitrophaceae bacterium]